MEAGETPKALDYSEEAGKAALNDCREVFRSSNESHQGHVIDTAGDSALAISGSVVEAVRAGVQIQDLITERNRDGPN